MALIGVAGGFMSPATPTQPGGAVKRYDVVIDGNKTTLLLSDQDARARGLVPAPAPAPAPEPVVPTKAATPANKGRRTATKRAAVLEQAFGAKAGDE